jgi:hypothetical protein
MAILNFKDPDKIIYTPEDEESDFSTTDIIEICKGNIQMAHGVASLCEWQNPGTIIDELLREGEIEETNEGLYKLNF